jgi:hypothetical protein
LRVKAATLLLMPLLLVSARDLRAEYVVLRSGQRLHVTGYQLLGDKYHLQLAGGWLEASVQDVVAIEPEDTFVPSPPQAPAAGNSLQELVAAAASRYGVDAELITSVIAVESNFDPKAVSPKNARGLMQLLPETAARLGVKDVFDPKENIDAGTRYLRELLETYHNDVTLALAAYNAGPDRVQQYGSVPPFRETVSYVRRVKRTYEKGKASPAHQVPQPAAPSPGGLARVPGAAVGAAAAGPSASATPSGAPTPNTVPSAPTVPPKLQNQ